MKELLTEIKQMMYEELGISNIVIRETKSIISRIVEDSKQYSYNTVKKGNFKYTTEDNHIINVYYQLYYCVDNNHTPDIEESGYSDITNKDEYVLETTVIYVKSENKYKDYMGTTQHEMDHIYKMIQSGKHLLSDTSYQLYEKAQILISKNDTISNLIGTVIYYNNAFERDAFINETYKTIMDNNDTDPYQTIKNTIYYKNIQLIKQYIIDSDKYKNKITDICKKEFNKSYKWFYNITKNMIDSYIWKIGRLLVKVNKDLNIKRLDDIWPTDLSKLQN